MFGDIARFLIDTVCTLFGAVLILRAWMQVVRLPSANPVSQGVIQVTNWLVLPLRRVIPAAGGIDWASVVGAWLTAVVYLVLMVGVAGGEPLNLFPIGLVVAVLVVVKWAVSLLMWLTLLMALLSWVNPRSQAMAVLYHLTAPFLNPIRRVVPLIGGADLSPLLLFVIAQIVLMIIGRVSLLWFGV